MADNIPTDVGILASKDIGGVEYPLNLLADTAGADAMGLVAASPEAYTLLGRLKTIADGITTLSGNVDGLEALSTALNGFVDGLEALLGTTNTSLTALGGYVDGLEAALAGVLTETTFTARIPTLGQKAASGSVSVVLASGSDPATSAKQDAGLVTAAPFAITPHATDPLERQTKAIAIKTAGTLVYRYPGETDDRTLDLQAGLWPIPATHVRATSTASGLTGF